LSGKLYIVGTPIGNLADISKRTEIILKECDTILAEDTRITLKLLNHLGLKKHILSCHEFNEIERLSTLKEAVKENRTLAIVCDAGTPLISDPGYRLVQEAITLGIEVIPIPGPSAFVLALIGSGLPCDRFAFEGFLPDQAKAMKEKLLSLKDETRTLVFYVAPHKLLKTLEILAEVFAERPACLAKELTKIHEEFKRGTILSLKKELAGSQIRGEYVLIVEGASPIREKTPLSSEAILSVIKQQLKSGQHVNEIAIYCARLFGLKKSEVYKMIVEHMRSGNTEQDLPE
jgi:16S rRNA (cytidine1402-2'-O)-methyltransferase